MFRRALRRVPAILVVLSCLLATADARAQDTVSASFLLDTPGSAYASFGGTLIDGRGQTFTADVAGQLTSVAFRAGHTDEADEVVRIAIHAVDESGLPVLPALTSKDFAPGVLPLGSLEDVVVFDMTDAPTQLQRGVTYAITMTIDPTASSGAPYFLNGSTGANASYAGGNALSTFDGVTWQASTSTDYHFAVRVDDSVDADVSSFGSRKAAFGH